MHIPRRLSFLFVICSLFFSPAGAQIPAGAQSMADIFRAMPDSLLPTLTLNNRLDMVDFREANMKAEVTNLLDGTSTMTALTADSLSINVDTVLRVDIWLQRPVAGTDSTTVCLRRTYRLSDNREETVDNHFTTTWQPLPHRQTRSTLLRRDDKLLPASEM